MKASKYNKNYTKVSSKEELVKVLSIFQNSSITIYKRVVEEAVKDLYDYIINVMNEQTYKWKPLNEEYRKRKIRKGLSGKILIATGSYKEAIFYEITEDRVFVGVPNSQYHDTKLTYSSLAKIHEFGSKVRNIPARPLWRPALSAWVRRWNSKYKGKFYTEVEKEFKTKMGNS